MNANRQSIVLPVLLIGVGGGWLLSVMGIVPEINWVWTLGLAVFGFLTFAVGGLDKMTVVVGTFFIVTSCLSVLRQTGHLPLDYEVPILVMVAGALMLVARHPSIPIPQWVLDNPKQKEE